MATSLLGSLFGWLSIIQHIQHPSNEPTNMNEINCPQQQPHQHQQLQEWKSQSARASISATPFPVPVPATVTAYNDTGSSNQQRQQQQQQIIQQQPHHHRRLRVLMGIFTYDRGTQMPYRRQFRKIFELFPQRNDTRVCSLYDFEHAASDELRYECQFIYTFVVGGLKKDSARTELVDDSDSILIPEENYRFQQSKDLRESNDVTYLNIRENMNEGKSQTWFKFATTIMEKYDLDYTGKIDSDSLPYLDKFFNWAYTYLPPPPYNRGIIAGAPIDKMWWSRNKAQINEDVNEDFFRASYGKVMHLYAAGQCYIMSRDLAHTVVLEAPKSNSYREGHEDHDISAMAFHSPKPISFHFLSLQQQFWRHPVKRYKKKVRLWRTRWHNENVRMKKVLNLRQEYLRSHHNHQQKGANANEDDDNMETPDDLIAPVQQKLDDVVAASENEEEEEEDEESSPGEEDLDNMVEDGNKQQATDV